MKKTIIFFLLAYGAINVTRAQIVVPMPVVAGFTDALLSTANLERVESRIEDLATHTAEKATSNSQLATVAAKLVSSDEAKNMVTRSNFLKQIEKYNDQINLLKKELAKYTIVADAVQALAFVEATVTGSMKLKQIYSLSDQINIALKNARDTTLLTQYIKPVTITTNAPVTTGTKTDNTTFTTTYKGSVFSSNEQKDIIGMLDMMANNLKWQTFDVANVITQTVTFTGSSGDRYKLITGVYENVYKIFQDTRKFMVGLNQTVLFRKLQAAAQGIGPGTNISF